MEEVAADLRAEVRRAREAREARERVRSALGTAIAGVGLALGGGERADADGRGGRVGAAAGIASSPSDDDAIERAWNAPPRRPDDDSDLLSDAALRRIVDRIYREQVAATRLARVAGEGGEEDEGAERPTRRSRAAARGDERYRRARRPLSAEEFDALPSLRYGEEEDAAKEEEEEEEAEADAATTEPTEPAVASPPPPPPEDCVICACAFAPADALKRLPCGHSGFHVDCIRAWLSRSPTCPLCRCACRAAPPPRTRDDDDDDGDDDDDDDDDDGPPSLTDASSLADDDFVSTEHLAELQSMHAEESAWLDRLESQPRARLYDRLYDLPAAVAAAAEDGTPTDADAAAGAEDAARTVAARTEAARARGGAGDASLDAGAAARAREEGRGGRRRGERAPPPGPPGRRVDRVELPLTTAALERDRRSRASAADALERWRGSEGAS